MKQGTPSSPSLRPERGRTTKGHPAAHIRRVGAYGFLLLIVMPTILLLGLVGVDIMRHLGDIDKLASTANTQHLPGILASQRTLINLENLRRYVETIYTSSDPAARREAELNALALSTESIFEPDSRFAEYAGSATVLIRQLSTVKKRSSEASDRLHDSELYLTRSLSRLVLQGGLNTFMPLPHNSRHIISVREQKRNEELYAKASAQLAPVLALCDAIEANPAARSDLLADCKNFRSSWSEVGNSWREQNNADAEARTIWRKLDDLLRELSDLASSEEAELTYKAMVHIRAEAQTAQTTFYVSFALLVLVLAIFAFALHRSILSPLALASRNLRRIRDGLNAEPMPPVRIRELQEMLNLLPSLSAHIAELSARSGELEREKTQYATLSFKDGLTGVNNRRSFDLRLSEALPHHSLALLMLDVDLFKRYNDTYGHQAGDMALSAVAKTMEKALLRSSDRVFRYGGEEFAVLLPDASEDSALAVAIRILLHVRALVIPHATSSVSSVLTVSIGVALRQADSNMTDTELVAQADKALYSAKSSGRDRVCLYSRGECVTPPTPFAIMTAPLDGPPFPEAKAKSQPSLQG